MGTRRSCTTRCAVALWMTAFIAPVSVGAQVPLPVEDVSFEELSHLVIEKNLALKTAELAVQRARIELDGESTLIDSTLTLESDVRTTSAEDPTWTTRSAVALPLAPQLSVGADATLNQDSETEERVSVTVRPLRPGRSTWEERRAYAVAIIRRAHLRRSVTLEVEKAALTVMIRRMEQEIAEDTVALEELLYEQIARRGELGDVSFQDVQSQQVDLIAARQRLFAGQRALLQDWNVLQRFFAPSDAVYNVGTVEPDQLYNRIAALQIRRDDLQGREPTTEALETLQAEATALESRLDATPAWRPELDITAGVTVSDPAGDAKPSTTVGIGVTVSPDQFRRDDREQQQTDIQIKRMEIAAEQYGAVLERELRQQRIEIGTTALASAELQVQRDELALREAELQVERGGRTQLELQQLRINLRRAEVERYQAAVDLYIALGEYALLF